MSDQQRAEQDGRDPACVERWPECESGGYDPRCCRFPKSCSCEKPRAGEGRPRYVVLVWMFDHWGVTFETNDRVEAIDVMIKASKKVPALCIDTETGDVV